MNHQLDRAIARFRPRPGRRQDNGDSGRLSAAAFRAAVEQRLAALERDLGELKGRINGLIFLVLGTVMAQLVLRLFG